MRIYYATFRAVAVSAQQDFFQILTPATAGIVLLRISLYQSASVVSQMLGVVIKRGHTSAFSGGTTITPARADVLDTTSACTVIRNNTVKGAGGTPDELYVSTFNVLNGLNEPLLPLERMLVGPSTRVSVELDTTPSPALTMRGQLVYGEGISGVG